MRWKVRGSRWPPEDHDPIILGTYRWYWRAYLRGLMFVSAYGWGAVWISREIG